MEVLASCKPQVKSSPPQKVQSQDTAILDDTTPANLSSDKMSTFMPEPGFILHPRPKKSVLPPPNKKRRVEHKIEEISFDDSKREDYLTGFHKRKVQRIKRAQEENEKKAREERREMRKQASNLAFSTRR